MVILVVLLAEFKMIIKNIKLCVVNSLILILQFEILSIRAQTTKPTGYLSYGASPIIVQTRGLYVDRNHLFVVIRLHAIHFIETKFKFKIQLNPDHSIRSIRQRQLQYPQMLIYLQFQNLSTFNKLHYYVICPWPIILCMIKRAELCQNWKSLLQN